MTACRKECVTDVAAKRSCRGRAGEACRGRAEGVTSVPCLRSKQTNLHANTNQSPIHEGAKAPPATPRETKAEPSHVKELPMCNNGQNSGAFMSHVSFACSSRTRISERDWKVEGRQNDEGLLAIGRPMIWRSGHASNSDWSSERCESTLGILDMPKQRNQRMITRLEFV